MALNFSEYDPSQQFTTRKPGRCHLLVAAVEEKESFYEVACDIVAHDDESEVGQTTKVRLNKAGKGARRQQDFLIATKVITLEEILEAQSRGETEIDPDLNDAVGVSFFSTLEEGSYTSKKSGKEVKTCDVQFEFIAADDSAAAEYPRDTELVPNVPGGGAAPASKPKQKKEEKVTVPASDDDCPF
jgi:hypothetical protein